MIRTSWRRRAAVAALFSFFVCIGVAIPRASAAAAPLSFGSLRSVDVMKYTKDVMTSQPSDSEVKSLAATVKSLGATAVGLSIPMDPTSAYPSGSTPSPRTAESFTYAWADAVHSAGLNVLWRGTFSGIEGLYGFTKHVGSARIPAGTAASAATDGQSTWLGRVYGYIVGHPSYFADGDLWAPMPERTEGIFDDATSFLPSTGAGIQANYARFMIDLKAVSDQAFAAIGKRVTTGLTANNYSEIASGWIPQSVFDAAGYVAVDYYGSSHTPAEMDADLRAIATAKGKPVFVEEWGDYWTGSLSQPARAAYLQSMYAELHKLVSDGVVVGFNSWTGWAGSQESTVMAGLGGFVPNYAGAALKAFFQGAVATIGVNTAQASTQPAPSTPIAQPAASAAQDAGLSCPGPASNAFTGCYYSGTSFGTLAAVRTDSSINFDWGQGNSPASGVPAHSFSVRWSGVWSFDAGTYEFDAHMDDGYRVFVDGAPVIDAWYGQSAYAGHTGTIALAAGSHTVTVEYYQDQGGAVAKLSWARSGEASQDAAAAPKGDSSFQATYFTGTGFGQQVLSRQDQSVDFDWGQGSPDPSVPVDQFSARWQGSFAFAGGSHAFTVTADDGARLYVDGALVIDGWKDQGSTTFTAVRDLSAGLHTVKMEYYEAYGGAVAKLSWD